MLTQGSASQLHSAPVLPIWRHQATRGHNVSGFSLPRGRTRPTRSARPPRRMAPPRPRSSELHWRTCARGVFIDQTSHHQLLPTSDVLLRRRRIIHLCADVRHHLPNQWELPLSTRDCRTMFCTPPRRSLLTLSTPLAKCKHEFLVSRALQHSDARPPRSAERPSFKSSSRACATLPPVAALALHSAVSISPQNCWSTSVT